MSFQISVQPSGRIFSADSTETLLAAGIRQGIGLPYGCKDGACGSCKCKKISGTVVHGEHQPKALSADEEAQGLILTCWNRARWQKKAASRSRKCLFAWSASKRNLTT